VANFTIANVISAARDKLGDNTAVAAGLVVTDAEFLSFIRTAQLELRQICRNISSAYAFRREMYVFVAPNVGLIQIDYDNVLKDVAILDKIWERKVDSYQSIANVAGGTGFATVTLFTPHGRLAGDQVQIANSAFDWINGLRTIASVGGSTNVLIGGVRGQTGGAETSSGAVMMYSTGSWNIVGVSGNHITTDIPIENIPLVTLVDGGIRINPVSQARVMKITCLMGASNTPATGDVILFGDSFEFLALKAALLAHISKAGNPERVAALMTELYGPGGDAANVVGGAAKLLRRGFTLQSQWVRRIRPRFRAPRQVPTQVYIRF